MKTYYQFMSEITSDELYDRLVEYGMFSEKLPPIFSAKSFLDYCKNEFFCRQFLLPFLLNYPSYSPILEISFSIILSR